MNSNAGFAFWRMNWARLPENWYNQFFNLLHETRDNPTDDVVIIVNELEEVLQGQRRYKAFSFCLEAFAHGEQQPSNL